MKKRFKTVVTTAMVAALTASLLTGCGSSTDDTTASAPETGEALSLIHISEPTRPY